jgi:hypothetical protein
MPVEHDHFRSLFRSSGHLFVLLFVRFNAPIVPRSGKPLHHDDDEPTNPQHREADKPKR